MIMTTENKENHKNHIAKIVIDYFSTSVTYRHFIPTTRPGKTLAHTHTHTAALTQMKMNGKEAAEAGKKNITHHFHRNRK
jgi:hypothetical protein